MANNWLKQRCEILAKYADTLPTTYDTVHILFENPEWGWMPVHLHKNGVDMGTFEISNVYDSFGPIREWLETIADIGHDKAIAVNLNCEDVYVVLYYEPMWFFDYDQFKGNVHPRDCGIFSVYVESKDRFLFDAYCETYSFVKNIYEDIINYAKSSKDNPDFIENWVEGDSSLELGELEEDDPRIKELFLNKMRSQKIEAYLRHCEKWRH